MSTKSVEDYRVQFIQHIGASFAANVREYRDNPVRCGGNIHLGWGERHEGTCDQPVHILFAWHFNDDAQGDLRALCQDHELALIELAGFRPNDFFLDVAEIVWPQNPGELEAYLANAKPDPLA
jgi:hypothetical protein